MPLERRKTTAIRKSLQASRKAKIAVDRMPGSELRSTILTNPPNSAHPSIQAASSRATGIVSI